MFNAKSVPPEIWMQILREASSTPGSLDPTVHSQFDKFKHDIEDNYRNSMSMSTKWSLMRVCKQWYPLAVELFYEDARPKFMYQLDALKKRIPGEQSLSGHSLRYGWWTKKLIMPNNPAVTVGQFFDVFSFLPNLRILIFLWPLQVTVSEFDGLMTRLRGIRTLRYLQCTHAKRFDSPADALLAAPPCVTFAHLHSVATHVAHTPPFPPSQLTYLALSLPDVPNLGRLWVNWYFPNLRHLSLISIFVHEAGGAVKFVKIHSGTLRSLTLELRGWDVTSPITDEDFLCPCSSLTELILLHNMPSPTSTSLGVYPNVISLGITAHLWAFTRRPLKELYGLSRFPNLQQLRVVEDAWPPNLIQDMLDGFPRGERGAVRLEDARGRELEEAREGLGLDVRAIWK